MHVMYTCTCTYIRLTDLHYKCIYTCFCCSCVWSDERVCARSGRSARPTTRVSLCCVKENVDTGTCTCIHKLGHQRASEYSVQDQGIMNHNMALEGEVLCCLSCLFAVCFSLSLSLSLSYTHIMSHLTSEHCELYTFLHYLVEQDFLDRIRLDTLNKMSSCAKRKPIIIEHVM